MLKQYRGLDKKGKTFITSGPPTDPGDGASQPVWLKEETIRLQSTAAEQRVGVGDLNACFPHVRRRSSTHKFSEEESLIVSRLDSGAKSPHCLFVVSRFITFTLHYRRNPSRCAPNTVRDVELASTLLTHWHLEIFSGNAGSGSIIFKKLDVLLFFHYYCAALETFIVIAAMTRDTWEADASAVYEMETEEGHLRWLRELISARVKTERKRALGLFFFITLKTRATLSNNKRANTTNTLICFAGALLS